MEKSKIENLNQRLLCTKMIKAGFKNSVIEIGTGITNSMVRALRTELGVKEYGDDKSNSGQLRIASRIVDNRRRVVDAGIIISLYKKVAKDASKSVDFDSLIETHKFYMETHEDIYGNLFNPIDINEAFVLVRDYRSRNGSIQVNTCQCGADYIIVSNQRMAASCPLCSLETKSLQLTSEEEEKIIEKDFKDRMA